MQAYEVVQITQNILTDEKIYDILKAQLNNTTFVRILNAIYVDLPLRGGAGHIEYSGTQDYLREEKTNQSVRSATYRTDRGSAQPGQKRRKLRRAVLAYGRKSWRNAPRRQARRKIQSAGTIAYVGLPTAFLSVYQETMP